MFIAFLTAFLIAFLVAPLVIHYYRKHHWVDNPQIKKHVKNTHQRTVPRGGGLVIFAGIACTSLLFIPLSQQLIGILIGATMLMVVGWLDDIYDLHPFIRLTVNILAALAVIFSGVGIAYVSNPLASGVIHLDQPQLHYFLFGQKRSIWLLADFFALIFIVWNMNIIDWAKGVAGQLPGFVTVSALFIALLSTRFAQDPHQSSVTLLALAVAGSFLALLIYNWYPQKMMPGYGAGSLAGYFLAVLAILSGAKLATTLMVLAIPTADAIFTILRRILAGKAPYWGDRGHLHHKLLDVLGWSQPQVAIFYWITSFIFGLVSLKLNSFAKLIMLLIIFIAVFSFLIWAKLAKMNGRKVNLRSHI